MDDNDRASDSEEQDRILAQRRHAEQHQAAPGEECRHCDEPLEQHRQPFGTCIDCQTMVEQRARHYRRD